MSRYAPIVLPVIVLTSLHSGCGDCPITADPCRSVSLMGGVEDNFALGNVETADVAPELMALMDHFYPIELLHHQFDQTSRDRPVGHTFQLPDVDAEHPVTVEKAVLTLRVKPTGGSFHHNDGIEILYSDENNTIKYTYVYDMVHLNGGDPGNGEPVTFVLDLANMRPTIPPHDYPSDIRDRLRLGKLHVYVQDDTSVDFMKLDVEYCGH